MGITEYDTISINSAKMQEVAGLKVLVSEDHALFRDGMNLLLREAFNHIELIEACNFSTTKALLKEHSDINLVLLDIQMPGTSGLEGLKTIKEMYPILPVVVVSTVDRHASVQQMMSLGADGFITKTSSREVMINALRDVMAGERVIISEHDDTNSATLSLRQKDIVDLLDNGLSNKEIAVRLKISPSTVRDHISEISRLFKCENRTELAVKMRRLGYVID